MHRPYINGLLCQFVWCHFPKWHLVSTPKYLDADLVCHGLCRCVFGFKLVYKVLHFTAIKVVCTLVQSSHCSAQPTTSEPL